MGDGHRKKSESPAPDVTAKVYLVPYGYEIDFCDANGKEIGFTCRDFGGDIPIKKARDLVVAGMISAMEKLEDVHLKLNKRKKQ